jgi:ribosome-binding protein aMBF1 (putative translation factor)
LGALKVKIKVRCKIGELLKSEGRSQTWLAEQIQSTPPQVNDWCTGKYIPSIGYIMRIQKATGWTLDQIFEEIKEG